MANENEISPEMQEYLKDKRAKQPTVKERVFAEGVSEDMKEFIKQRDKNNANAKR